MIGSYVIREKLSENARYRRYLAQTLGSGRWVEIKVMQKRYKAVRADAGLVANPYVHELRVASAAHSECIVRHIDAGTSSAGEHYLVREWHEEGITAREALVRSVRLNVPTAFTLVADCASAVMHLHDAGYVHRDLRPEKVMVLKRRSGYQSVLMDLGSIGRRGVGAEADVMGEYVGIPLYMAPEQLHSDKPDVQVDIFGLAGLLYQLITGIPPLLGAGATAKDHRSYLKGEGPIPIERATRRVKSLPEDMDAFLSKCMHRDPSHRPDSIQYFFRGLRHVLKAWSKDRGDSAVPKGLMSRLSKLSD